MARYLIQNATTGQARIVGDAGWPFFENQGYIIVDTLEDGQPATLYYSGGESDLRYVNVSEISDPESAASVALRAAFGSFAEDAGFTRSGNLMIALGDSITQSSDLEPGIGVATQVLAGESWLSYAGLLSGQRINRIRNAGIGGQTSAQMLARFDADVAAYNPTIVAVLAGTNDIGQSVPIATWQANMEAIFDAIREIGAQPVACTITPQTSSTNRANIVKWNAWLRRYAARNRLPLVDFYAALVDPVAGGPQAAYITGDGVHPSAAGYVAMGQRAVSDLSAWLPPVTPPITQSSADPHNGGNPVASNQFDGLFNGSVAGSGLAAPWVQFGSLPSGSVQSVTTDAQVLGKMQRVTNTATASDTLFYRQPSVGNPANNALVVGHRLLFTGIVTTSGIGARLQVNFDGSSKSCRPLDITRDVTRGRWYAEETIPTGTTSISHILTAKAGTGYAEFGQVTMYDLTAMGLA